MGNQLPFGMKPKKKYTVNAQMKRANWDKVSLGSDKINQVCLLYKDLTITFENDTVMLSFGKDKLYFLFV